MPLQGLNEVGCMDAFEQLVATILRRQGYWVHQSFKVELTKEEKREMRRPTSPRWELDLIAYKGGVNRIFVVECKSYLDSAGLYSGHLVSGDRYKLFTDPKLREVVFSRLVNQLIEAGSCRPDPTVTLCLAAGHIHSERDRSEIRQIFAAKEWQLWDEGWLIGKLEEMNSAGYENDVAQVVVKLLSSEASARTDN